MVIKGILRHPGGKSKALKQIDEQLPDSFDEYREPFLGGGSVLFHIRQKYPIMPCWVNDLNPELFYFWICARDYNDQLVSEITRIRDTCTDAKALYLEMKDVSTESLTDIERAIRFFILNRITFSGLGDSGGFSMYAYHNRFTASSIDRLVKIQPLLQGVRITNLDYNELLQMRGNNVLCFLDPPYYKATKHKLYGKGGDLHTNFDHDRFFTDVRECNHKVLITYDNCDKITELATGLKVEEWQLQYSMRNNDKGKELFIRNY